MKKIQYLLFALIGVPLLFILIWLIAFPADLLKEEIEEAVARSGTGNMMLSVAGLKKGIFLSLSADSLDLSVHGRPALKITSFSGICSLTSLMNRRLGFTIAGNMGTGDIHGRIELPLEGTIRIDRAELNAIPYLTQFGIDIKGKATSDINISNDTVNVLFEVPDLYIDDTASVIPLLSTFRKLQGSLTVSENRVTIDSIGLEGEKGYARLKGDVVNNIMDLRLELMPVRDKLNSVESMLIGRYVVSPGYYVVPIQGPLP